LIAQQMQGFQATLSTQGLTNIPFHKYTQDFEFVVGGARHHCSSFVADFLSPKIARLHSVDASVCCCSLATEDENNEFGQFLALGSGGEIEITSSNQIFISQVCLELENSELFDIIVEHLDSDLTLGNVFERLDVRKKVNLRYLREIDFLANHFYQLPESVFQKLTIDDIAAVLSSASLQLANEDALYELIASHLDHDSGFVGLLQFVRFEFLTAAAIAQFVEKSYQIFPLLDISIWSRICARLILTVKTAAGPPNQ
jgi:hypothetical protein